MDISNLSIRELEQLSKQIPLEIQERKEAEKKSALKELSELAVARGFTLEELLGNKIAESASPRKGTRKPAKVKYRHPQRPELTWTGRGRKPAWVAEWLANGNAIETLAA